MSGLAFLGILLSLLLHVVDQVKVVETNFSFSNLPKNLSVNILSYSLIRWVGSVLIS
jgi:hypothetical protein